jgi:hypothetical protein
MFLGMTFGDWLAFLRANDFQVDPSYWMRAASISANSLANSLFRQFEERAIGPLVEATSIQRPLFVLGHARSGTTYLHNLLAVDPRFAYPNVFEVYYPHTFLCTQVLFAKVLGAFLPTKRPQDNVALSIRAPAEDEVANCISTHCSPYMRYVVPYRADYYDRYYTFRRVEEEETERWKRGFMFFLKKLTWKHNRPLLLKSPPHTCRISLLLQMFPDARFVHIHRNPYHVFKSIRHLDPLAFRSFTLQRPEHHINARILHIYKHMYHVFFAERHLVPAGRFHDVSFERLERDPVTQVRRIYEALELPSFDMVRPRVQRYVDSLASYRKNRFPNISVRLRRKIRREWHRSFEEWGYPA